MNFKPHFYITDDAKATWAVTQLLGEKLVGFDSETTGLNPLLNDRLRLVQLSGSKATYIFDIFRLGQYGKAAICGLLENRKIQKVAHNLKFDLKFAKVFLGVKYFKNGIDTQLAHQVLNCGIEDTRFDLSSTCWEFLNHGLEKELQTSDWSARELSPQQLEYAARDAEILLELWPVIAKKLVETNLFRTAQLEFDCVDFVAQLELNGILLNEERWMALHDSVKIEWADKRKQLQDMLIGEGPQKALFDGAPSTLINPGSSKQLIEAFTARGIQLPLNDDGTGYTTRNFKIEPLALEHEEIRVLLDWRKLEKQRSSYGPSWILKINPYTGRIHANFHQLWAKTGRMSCSDPNLQQAPTDPRFRRSFVAEPGHKFVKGDYSQFEYRILADYSKDPELIRAFVEGRDFHQHTADLIRQPRAVAKNYNFAVGYGGGIMRLALMARILVEEAEKVMRADKQAFPQKHKWLAEAAAFAVINGYSITRGGRITKYTFDRNDPQQVALTQRNGKNTPIQGTNADVLKRACKLIGDELQGQQHLVRQVHLVHDEIDVEAVEGCQSWAADMVYTYMMQAGQEYIKNVPVKVDINIGDDWSKEDE